MEHINSKEYWDSRFASNDWAQNAGPSQTEYFTKLFLENVPQWFVHYVQKNSLSVLDLGCATGEGTKILLDIWENVSGADISEHAVATAREKYPGINFDVQDVFNLTDNWDVIYLSNVLEHFEDPYKLLTIIGEHACSSVVIMVPFEESADIDEHFAKFGFDNIPIRVGDMNLVYHNNITEYDIETAKYFGQQILLIYTKDSALAESVSIQKSSNVIERWVVSDSYQDFKNRYYEMEFSFANSQYKIEELNQELKRNRDFSAEQDKVNKKLMEELTMLDEELKNAKEYSAEQIALLEQKLKEAQEAYDNLYAYSCKRDDELVAIKNSRSYQFFMKWLKKPMSIAYRIAHKFYRTFKALFTLNMSALKTELGGPLKKCRLRLNGVFDKRKAFATLKSEAKNKRVVVLPPTLDWHMPLFQRPQQLANSYARKDNTIVLYLTKNIQYDQIPSAERISDTLWVVNELYADKLPQILSGASEVILSVSWTPNKKYLDILKPDKFIYEYIDELEIFHMYGPEMEKDHQNLMKNADVTICTATKLYNQAVGIAKNPLLSPNAGDYEFFAKTDSYEISPLIADMVRDYDCVLGYYGALAAWFDYELVKEVAAKHPEWLLVLVGIDYDKTIGKSGIDQYPNIVHIPPQPYVDLPKFLKGFDIATIPFVINEITLSTSPVKLFEYMAAGKPIIASKMPECLKYDSVKTYSNVDEFCGIVAEYMAMKSDDIYWDDLKRDALDNTWDARTEEILEAIS